MFVSRATARMMFHVECTGVSCGSVVILPGLRRRRLLATLTQQELADRTGLTSRTIIRLEGGGEARPPTVRRLARALRCMPGDLIEPERE